MAISSFLARKSCLSQNYKIGSDGWTTFYPSHDTRFVYVSTTDGSNANDGLTPSTPKASIYDNGGSNGAWRLMRDNYPDWLLLKRGDTFQNGWQTLGSPNISLHGRSRFEPMLIGAYGPNANADRTSSSFRPMGDLTAARPVIVPALGYSSTENFFSTIQTYPGDIVFNSLEFYDYRNDPSNVNTGIIEFRGDVSSGSQTITNVTNTTNLTVGMKIIGPGVRGMTVTAFDAVAHTITVSGTPAINATNVLFQAYFSVLATVSLVGHCGLLYVEDCKFNYTGIGITNALGPATIFGEKLSYAKGLQLILRRNTVWKCRYLGGLSSAGVFMQDFPTQVYPTIVEENFFHQCGWDPDVMGCESIGTNHNAYCHDIHNTHIFAGNVTSFSSRNGYMQRNGTKAYNNAFLCNPVGSVMGTGIIDNPITVSHNTFLQGTGDIAVNLIATSTANGVTTVDVDRLASNSAGSFASQFTAGSAVVENIDNPGSVPFLTLNSVANSKTITLSSTVSAGTRGNGIQVGDRLRVWRASISSGSSTGGGSTIPACGPPGNTTVDYVYSVGSSGPFYVTYDKRIPSWVQVGHKVTSSGVNNNAWGASYGTIASIDPDKRSFTTSNTLTSAVLAGVGYEFNGGNTYDAALIPEVTYIFWDSADLPGSAAHYPSIRIGPNNIYANSESPTDNNAAISTFPTIVNGDASGNYIYLWIRTAALTSNFSLSGPGVGCSGFDSASQSLCTKTAADVANGTTATIEGYMTSLGLTPTKDAFYTACNGNYRGNYDVRFTANAINNYIRGIFGVTPLTITYPAYNYNTAT